MQVGVVMFILGFVSAPFTIFALADLPVPAFLIAFSGMVLMSVGVEQDRRLHAEWQREVDAATQRELEHWARTVFYKTRVMPPASAMRSLLVDAEPLVSFETTWDGTPARFAARYEDSRLTLFLWERSSATAVS